MSRMKEGSYQEKHGALEASLKSGASRVLDVSYMDCLEQQDGRTSQDSDLS